MSFHSPLDPQIDSEPRTILIIEDSREDVEFIQTILDEFGEEEFRLEHKELLDDGLERLALGKVDLILLDLVLPDSRGFATFLTVYEEAPGIPIIVMTGLADERLAIKALFRGAQDYLPKGNLDPHVFMRALRYAIERKRAETALIASEENLRSTQNELMHAGKLAALGQMAANIAHELNQPLEASQAYIDNLLVLLNANRFEEMRDSLSSLSQIIRHAGKITNNIKIFIRKNVPLPEPVSLQKSLEQALSFLMFRIKQEGTTILKKFPDGDILVEGDPVQLNQVFLNILTNALDALAETRKPELEVELKHNSHSAHLTFKDNGPGIPPESMGQIFEPFFSTKGRSQGLGLGLAISRSIVQDFGGTLLASNQPDSGAIFTLQFPIINNNGTKT